MRNIRAVEFDAAIKERRADNDVRNPYLENLKRLIGSNIVI
jgi:hypothetical protein